jgi:hypothetical protein
MRLFILTTIPFYRTVYQNIPDIQHQDSPVSWGCQITTHCKHEEKHHAHEPHLFAEGPSAGAIQQ